MCLYLLVCSYWLVCVFYRNDSQKRQSDTGYGSDVSTHLEVFLNSSQELRVKSIPPLSGFEEQGLKKTDDLPAIIERVINLNMVETLKGFKNALVRNESKIESTLKYTSLGIPYLEVDSICDYWIRVLISKFSGKFMIDTNCECT